jgi:hypothetical protein
LEKPLIESKNQGVPPSSITNCFGCGINYSKNNLVQKKFIDNLVLHAYKGCKSISIVKSSWFRRLVMKRDTKVKLFTCHQFVSKNILNIVIETMDTDVLPLLVKCATTSVTFDLGISKTKFDNKVYE